MLILIQPAHICRCTLQGADLLKRVARKWAPALGKETRLNKEPKQWRESE